MSDKSLHEEVADLAEAVRELRDREVASELRELRAEVEKLRAEKAGHSCHGHCCAHAHCNWGHCGCGITHYNYSAFGAAGGAQPLTYTVTTGGPNISVAPYVATNAAAGAPAITTFNLSN